MGANRDYILNRIPHISKLMMVSMDGVLDHADTLIIGNSDPEFKTVLDKVRPEQKIVDLVRLSEKGCARSMYEGICW
jgi:GDP-mannose 6-dehydrogenase